MTGDGSGHARMEALKEANLALRFLLELGALVALGDWGGTAGDGRGMKLLRGTGLPLLVIIVWVLVVAPKAAVTLGAAAKVPLGLAILEGATVALAGAGHTASAVAFGAIVPLNAALGLQRWPVCMNAGRREPWRLTPRVRARLASGG